MNRSRPAEHRGISRAFALGVLVIIVLTGLAFVLILSGTTPGLSSTSQTSLTHAGTSTLTTQTRMAGTATLSDLIAGKFPTALDKAGTGGGTGKAARPHILNGPKENEGGWDAAGP